MMKDKEYEKDTAEANLKINEIFYEGNVDLDKTLKGRSEAEIASIKMDHIFYDEQEQPVENVNPGFTDSHPWHWNP
jgi:hypothetical protein